MTTGYPAFVRHDGGSLFDALDVVWPGHNRDEDVAFFYLPDLPDGLDDFHRADHSSYGGG